LLDAASEYLVATAAKGIEEEVVQGLRIPVGRGFAGRIAAERRPVTLDRVDHTTVLNPILRDRGIRSLLGVPLLSEGRVLGVLHVGALSSRTFDTADSDLLQLVADRVALATQARLSENERLTAVALQNSLLPNRLPSLPGLAFAARYVPGEGLAVGGDWYDVFTFPSGSVCVAMGDVAGRGLRAAAIMGRVRSAFRSYAMTTDDPAEILTLVDRKIAHFEAGEMATVLAATFDLSHDHVRIASAGHPVPVLAQPGRPSVLLELPVDPPIGSLTRSSRRAASIAVPPGAVLCLYTDGLIERRGVGFDERFSLLLDAVHAEEPESVCTSVMRRLIGAEPPKDDVAVLVVRRSDDELNAPSPVPGR
jgi:serine phosphatase RsbU (regulator of sigma subunit)